MYVRGLYSWLQWDSACLFVCFFLIHLYFLFWPHCAACRILVPQLGIEPMLPAVEVWSLNHWTAREVPDRACHCMDHGGSSPCCQNTAGMPRANNALTPKIFRRVELISNFYLERWSSCRMGTWTGEVKLILPIASVSIPSHYLHSKSPEWTLSNGSKHKVYELIKIQWSEWKLGLSGQV